MTAMTPAVTTAVTTVLAPQAGAGLRWDARSRHWWWSGAPAQAQAIHAYCPVQQITTTCRLPDSAGLLAHTRSGRLLLGLPKRLCLADAVALPGGGAGAGARSLRMQALAAVDPAEPRTCISDGCTDRRGYLVFGTGNASADRRPIGSFYQYSRQHGLRRLALPAVAQATSICFSADGARLYFADAQQGRILRCTYDAELARVADIALFAELEQGAAPRGAAIDAGGCVWSAQSGQLVQYDADGKALRRIAIDCSAPAFGGAQLAQLAVAGPGGLFAVVAPLAAGLADTLFDDQDPTRQHTGATDPIQPAD